MLTFASMLYVGVTWILVLNLLPKVVSDFTPQSLYTQVTRCQRDSTGEPKASHPESLSCWWADPSGLCVMSLEREGLKVDGLPL